MRLYLTLAYPESLHLAYHEVFHVVWNNEGCRDKSETCVLRPKGHRTAGKLTILRKLEGDPRFRGAGSAPVSDGQDGGSGCLCAFSLNYVMGP